MADQRHVAATDQDSTIEVVVPLHTRHAATLRVIVASLGADQGLSVDEIDDLKLAVSEVFTVLIDSCDPETQNETQHETQDGVASTARITYTSTADAITVDLERIGGGALLQLDALATTILSSVVDEHLLTESGVSLFKRGRETSD